MHPRQIERLAEGVLSGRAVTGDETLAIMHVPDDSMPALLAAADRLRRHFRGEAITLCAICNARSGRCDQDCSFCAQSAHYDTDAPVYSFIAADAIRQQAVRARKAGARNFSIVTAGKRLNKQDMQLANHAVKMIHRSGVHPCASLGILTEAELLALRDAGLTRYHHNLETSRSFYGSVCTTRTFDDNVAVLRRAREARLEVCSGALMGLGETPAQRVELLLELRELGVDSAPLNFLIPIPGTPLADRKELAPLDCLRIVAAARFVLPDRHILIAGGRRENLRRLESMLFWAGASGLMIGDLLTTTGPPAEDDRQMIADLGLPPIGE